MRTILTNEKVHGPRGALKVLTALDLKRIESSSLSLELFLYLGRPEKNSLSTQYKGPILIPECGSIDEITSEKVRLSVGGYRTLVPGQGHGFEEPPLQNSIPLRRLFELPSNLEFYITAETPEQYRGLIFFRQKLLPELIRKGYNSTHEYFSSDFRLYLKRKDSKDGTLTMGINFKGLEVYANKVDGIEVFTKDDLEKLQGLEK